jgi:hypothetical protein
MNFIPLLWKILMHGIIMILCARTIAWMDWTIHYIICIVQSRAQRCYGKLWTKKYKVKDDGMKSS